MITVSDFLESPQAMIMCLSGACSIVLDSDTLKEKQHLLVIPNTTANSAGNISMI